MFVIMKVILLFWTLHLLHLVRGRHVVEDFSQNKDNVNTMFNNILENMKTFIKNLHATGNSLIGNPDATQRKEDFQSRQHKLKTSSIKTPPATSTQPKDSSSSRSTEAPKRTGTVSTLTPAILIENDTGEFQKVKSAITNVKQQQTSHSPSSTLSPSLRHIFKTTTFDTVLGVDEIKQDNRLAMRERKSIEPAPQKTKTVTTSPKTASTLQTTKATAKPKLNPKCLTLKELNLPLSADCTDKSSMSTWS